MTREEEEIFLRVSEQQGELVDWLRSHEFPPGKPGVPECMEKFPLLDEDRACQAIRQVREERDRTARAKNAMHVVSDEALFFVLRGAARKPPFSLPPFGMKDFLALPPNVRTEVRQLLLSDSLDQKISNLELVRFLPALDLGFGPAGPPLRNP